MMPTMRLTLVVLWVLVPSFAGSQTATPKYRSYSEMTNLLKGIASTYPELVHLESLGKTQGEKDLWVVGIRKGDPNQPRAMLIVGGVEPSQIAGSELALLAVEYLASSYGNNDAVTRLLDKATVYVVPRASPDATESYFASVRKELSTNGRPMDDDRDAMTDEDDVEDLNGDGLITLMRVLDPQGEWTTHADEPRIMKKAVLTDNERGQYRLYTEGLDNDKDERWNEDPKGGVNFNKNFTFNYQYFSQGSGPYQVSEPETRAVADFVFSHPSIGVIASFSPNDNLMRPWKSDPKASSTDDGRRVVTSVMKEDEAYYQFISKRFQEITGFSDAPKTGKGSGAFSEWAYYHAGRWSFSTHAWWAPALAAQRDSGARRTALPKNGPRSTVAETQEDESEQMLQTLRWYEASGDSGVFVPWTAFNHPDFPDKQVQIGGFRPFALQNPPADSLGRRAEVFNAFFIDLGSKLPSLEIRNVETASLRAGVYRVSVDVVNEGYFPTNSSLGHRLRWVRDVAVTLELSKGQSLVSGTAKQVLDPIGGNGSAATVSWVVIAPSGSSITVEAESPTCGVSTERIVLR